MVARAASSSSSTRGPCLLASLILYAAAVHVGDADIFFGAKLQAISDRGQCCVCWKEKGRKSACLLIGPIYDCIEKVAKKKRESRFELLNMHG